ncbi:MAG: hypothetical protein ACO377_13010 [Pseudomonadales bacterium]
MFKPIAIALVVLSSAGCATTEVARATHYWESEKASANRYQSDEHNCQRSAGERTGTSDVFSVSSDAYAAYRECMVSRGYVLRQY